VTDRTVNVRLNVDNSGARRTVTQSEQDYRRLGQAATAAGAQQQEAFQRAATVSQRAMERTAAVAQASGRATQESVRATSTSMGRLAAAAEEIPGTFSSASAVSQRAMQGIASSATAAASAVVTAETRMTEATAAAASGAQTSLAQRLVAGQALIAQQATLSAATASSATAQTSAMARAAAGAQSTATGMTRLAVTTQAVPEAFISTAAAVARATASMATSATSASAAVVAAEGRMSAATAAAATGTQLSLASRLALGEALIAQQTGLAAATAAHTSALGRLTTAATGAEKSYRGVRTGGLLMLAMFAAASVTAARFEKAMSAVRSVAIDANASLATQTQQFEALRTAALDAGRDTVFSASQAAEAETELARAGVSVADIIGGGLKGALSLAAAGQLSLAEAAVVSAQAMNTFSLKGKDVTHIADVLAAGANKSAADVHGLGEALRMGGLLAHQTGLSLEDTVGTLSAFADHALIGSDAGTSLKTMLQRLTPQSTEAANMMDQLNFSAYDAQGNFVGLTELARRLQSSFSNLTPEARNSAMGVIFGSDAVRAATILYEQGAAGIDHYRKQVDDNGAAARMAAIQMDNLAGDLQYL
jgi:TP901 family phage tail tape measure protein